MCAAAMLCVARPSHAYVDHFLNGTTIGALDKHQMAVLTSAFPKALSDAADGDKVPFQLPPNAKGQGQGQVIDGTFTPLKTRMEGRQAERWTGWYCRHPGGEWKKALLKD